MVEVITTDEFSAWWESLQETDADVVYRLVGLLEAKGVSLGFPYSSDIKGSRFALRELRGQGKPIRIFYAFDPKRQAVLLLGGDKTGDKRFYETMVPVAEKIWELYLAEQAAGTHGDENG